MTDMPPFPPDKIAKLREALSGHLATDQQSWDDAVSGKPGEIQGMDSANCDLWDEMPTIDSKAVARAANIFEDILGIPFSAKAIRSGGYSDVEDLVNDIVPKLIKETDKKTSSQGG